MENKGSGWIMTNWIWSCLWKICITPRTGDVTYFQSDDGILSTTSLNLQSDGMGSFQFSLINDGGAYNDLYHAGDSVDIWLDSDTGVLGTTKVLTGFIKKVGYNRSGVNNTLIIEGMDYKSKFMRILVHELYRGSMNYEAILSDLLTTYAPEVSGAGIQVTGKSLGVNETLRFDYITLYEAIERIQCLIGDWTWQISPALVMNFQPRGYVDTSKEIEDFDDVTFTEDDDIMTNRIWVFGGKDFALLSKSAWVGTASNNNGDAPLAYNDNLTTGWDSGLAQAAAQWYKLDLGAIEIFGRMYFDNSNFATKFPRNLKVEASKDNVLWDLITTVSGNTSRDLLIDFKQQSYRYVKITLTGSDTNNWAIGEIYIYSYYNLLSKSEDSGSIEEYGEYEKVIRDSSIVTKPQAKARAFAELQINKVPVVSGAIQLSYFYYLESNELVLINLPGTPINQKFAVLNVRYNEETFGSFKEMVALRSI